MVRAITLTRRFTRSATNKSTGVIGNVATFLQNRDDNFNWFDDHSRCLGNVKLTFGEDVKKGETRYLGIFLGNGKDDDITTTVRKNGTLVIEIPDASNRTQPILQNNGITSRRVSELEQQNKLLIAALETAGIDVRAIKDAMAAENQSQQDAAAQADDDLPF